MDVSTLKQDIIEYSQQIGIDKIGFAPADPFPLLKSRLYQQQSLGYQSGFEEKDIEKRTDPSLLLEGAASIIAIALAYPAKMKERPENTKQNRRGSFSRASWGTDYHHILRDRLSKLESFIKSRLPDAKIASMVDTGALSDRAVAERAGIGWVGKHTSLITKEYGSYVYLGELITNIPLTPDEPIEDLCGTCNLCVDKCPTDALVQGGQLNAQKCIAYLTQTKGFVPEPYRKAIGNRIYGCDTCQQVCPYNRGIDFHHHEEMEPVSQDVKPLLKDMLQMSNRSFKERFGYMAGSWRGKKPLQRNAIIALGNYKDATATDALISCLKEDPRPVIRGTAAWSLCQIASSASVSIRGTIAQALDEAVEKEPDEAARREMAHALEQLSC
ncbi:tRNA epoxyqueuosine(34) reductase QueG [Camelliibacillus cellulosilyticus]|uniref:Epoxyqueuosine reductase n=1 Tax=Camelliibacillus cellulosilyticus TaxID=2174486 RepID=A0ABV9GNZ5_9BACL